jgi:hypothetical protein
MKSSINIKGAAILDFIGLVEARPRLLTAKTKIFHRIVLLLLAGTLVHRRFLQDLHPERAVFKA